MGVRTKAMTQRTFVVSRSTVALAASLAAALAFAGCADNPVGRICDLGAVPAEGQAVVASASLDCVSRTCLRVPLTAPELPKNSEYPTGQLGLCSAECSSDDDCDRVPESPCQTGFSCGVPVTVGPFCCRKFCICKDYIVVPKKGGLPTPAACDAGNNANACCNLDNRVGNPAYPNCK